MFDWKRAEDVLYQISKLQLAHFLTQDERNEVYGLGFFCDLLEGVMLVANTRSFHDSSFQENQEWARDNPALYRWDIGNWEYPAGLAKSSSEAQVEFDDRWKSVAAPLANSKNEVRDQRLLERLCVQVLERLADDGVLSAARGLEGLVVLGPDDTDKDVLKKKNRLDPILKRRA